MTLGNALSIWDWPTALGLVFVGFLLGLVLLPLAWPVRLTPGFPYPVAVASVIATVAGVAFFIFLFVFRWINGVPNVERLLTSGLQWIIFSGGMSVGLKLRDRLAERPFP